MRTDEYGAGIVAPSAISLNSVGDVADMIRARSPEFYDAWVQAAQPGARLIYGMGIDAPSASGRGVAGRLRALSEAGLVRLHLVRARRDGEFPIDFLVVRRAKPVPKGFPVLPRPAYCGAGVTTNGHPSMRVAK